MSHRSHWTQPGINPHRAGDPSVFVEFLDREVRAGSWEELSKGTFSSAQEALIAGKHDEANTLLRMALVEAQELREIYDVWPKQISDWIRARGTPEARLDGEIARLKGLIGETAARGIEQSWHLFSDAADLACDALQRRSPDARALIEAARAVWQSIHDGAVDRVSGIIDIAVRLCGEDSLGDLWDYLLSDWYEIHAARYSVSNQPWQTSVHQLMVTIVDGFHAHLAGVDRQGEIEIIWEAERIGFRFAPCGSGGRAVDPQITGGLPRSAPPFNFAVTTKEHDWAWNKKGICSYCVHCCLLNEVMPIDRLGYPTRVIDPPVWNGESPEPGSTSLAHTACTWWIYRDPLSVPEEVYARVGRKKPTAFA